MPTRITPEQTLQAAAVAVRDKSVLDSDRYFIDGAITSRPFGPLKRFKSQGPVLDAGGTAGDDCSSHIDNRASTTTNKNRIHACCRSGGCRLSL